MKLNLILLFITILFATCLLRAEESQLTKAQFEHLLMTTISDHFSPAHLGPDQFNQVIQIISGRSHEADAYVQDRMSDKAGFKMGVSSIRVVNLLKITQKDDPQGALNLALTFRDRLKSELAGIESASITVESSDLENRNDRLQYAIKSVNDFIDSMNRK